MKIVRKFPILLIVWMGMLHSCNGQDNKPEQQKVSRNRLSQAKSNHLQQHVDNPVDWYEWDPEALEKAERENKPLISSIGYAACHWCHVMEHESFMDSTVAKLMNDKFVPIKADREERPDIDRIYMDAVQLLTGSGGWPLNAFALPDGKTFHTGTYFPKEQWKKLLELIAKMYGKEQGKMEAQAKRLTQGIQGMEVVNPVADKGTGLIQELW